ncbi:uncharacterized protein LOC133452604 [Cololabis saira]|uniref:uncharacterized protein LOC133452604 n=1 Tax=Cololabis saira TaxID=129043 RepID=UPI002AD5A7CC|nr:uncharacterized protein LOC133452604 [Cololabis saira]
MKFNLVLVALLSFTTWMNAVYAVHGPTDNCLCHQWSTTTVHPDRIVDYTVQKEGVCPIYAILFRTVLGKRLCSKPNTEWAQKVIWTVDAKKAASLGTTQSKDGSASESTPAAALLTNPAETKATTVMRQLENNDDEGAKSNVQMEDAMMATSPNTQGLGSAGITTTTMSTLTNPTVTRQLEDYKNEGVTKVNQNEDGKKEALMRTTQNTGLGMSGMTTAMSTLTSTTGKKRTARTTNPNKNTRKVVKKVNQRKKKIKWRHRKIQRNKRKIRQWQRRRS